MDELTKSISSPSWWFTVVIAGVVVSALGSFLKERIEKWASTVSQKSRLKRKSKLIEVEKRIAALIEFPDSRDKARFEILRNLSISIIFFLLSTIFFVLAVLASNIGISKHFLVFIFFPASLGYIYATLKLLQDNTYIELKQAEERMLETKKTEKENG